MLSHKKKPSQDHGDHIITNGQGHSTPSLTPLPPQTPPHTHSPTQKHLLSEMRVFWTDGPTDQWTDKA